MMLVGDVADRTAILIDDLADTSNTITRAARLVKKEGATSVIALVTHGILSGNAIDRLNKSDLDKIVVTNSVPQEEHKKRCPKLEVLEIGPIFAEVRDPTTGSRDSQNTNHSFRPSVESTTERASAFSSPMTRYRRPGTGGTGSELKRRHGISWFRRRLDTGACMRTRTLQKQWLGIA